jgi:hypothetical protein
MNPFEHINKKASASVTFAGVEWKFVILFYGSN